MRSPLAKASDPNQVGLVVVHGDGQVIKQCVGFSEEQITGLEVLEKSGLDLNFDVSGGIGGAVCRIDNEGCTYPQDKCFCQCQDNTSCIFWSYWHLKNNDWEFSGLGAANHQVRHGDVEGWVWGQGQIGSSASSPPEIPFDKICLPPTTATPTPTSTATPGATPTPRSTDTPEPTNTSKPKPTPLIHSFSADRLTINAGESVVLSWRLEDAEAAYLRYDGSEEGVIAPGSKTVSPATTTVYQLIARSDGGDAVAELTITVNNIPPTATPTGTLLPTSTPAPTSTPLATTTPQPTEATVVEALVIEAAAVAPTNTSTATPTVAAIDTPAPTLPPATATSTPAALSANNAESQPIARNNPRPASVVRRADAEAESGPSNALFYGGITVVVLLFLVAPVILLAAGWLTWWLRRPP